MLFWHQKTWKNLQKYLFLQGNASLPEEMERFAKQDEEGGMSQHPNKRIPRLVTLEIGCPFTFAPTEQEWVKCERS